MDDSPPEEVISLAIHGIDYLILYLDYAIWLDIEYDRKVPNTPVSLIRAPNEERESRIDEFVAIHRERLQFKWYECQCGHWERDRQLPVCPSCNLPMNALLEDEEGIRGRAWDELIYEVPGLWARFIVPCWIVQRVHIEDHSTRKLADIEFPRAIVQRKILERLEAIKNLYYQGSWERIHFKCTSDFLPAGATIEDKFRRYRKTRVKLTAAFNWLTGFANQYPEFLDDGEEHLGIRLFHLPVAPPGIQIAGKELAENIFKLDNNTWTIRFNSGAIHHGISLGKAAVDVQFLLQNVGKQFSIFELPNNRGMRPQTGGAQVATKEDYFKVLRQIAKLAEELRNESDPLVRQETEGEIEALRKHQNENFDKFGNPRELAGDVQKAIRSTKVRVDRLRVDKLHPLLPELAAHLLKNFEIGENCIYNPESQILWNFGEK